MLIYHPAFDGYHAAFRMLQLLVANERRTYDRDTIRILDFYLVFPQLIGEMHLSRAQQGAKRSFSQRKNKYHFSGSPRAAFLRMAPLQDMALRVLASKRLIDLDKLLDGLVVRSAQPIPQGLESLVRLRNESDSGLVKFLVNELGTIPLRGDEGLKARSELMDYRYDQA